MGARRLLAQGVPRRSVPGVRHRDPLRLMQPRARRPRLKQMKRLLFVLCITFVGTCSAAAPPERLVHGHRLVSLADPAVTISLPRSARYLGADRWDLFDICDAELHVFVEAG